MICQHTETPEMGGKTPLPAAYGSSVSQMTRSVYLQGTLHSEGPIPHLISHCSFLEIFNNFDFEFVFLGSPMRQWCMHTCGRDS